MIETFLIFLTVFSLILIAMGSIMTQYFRAKHGIPKDFKVLHYKTGSIGFRSGKICAWTVGRILKFSLMTGELQFEIPFERIKKVSLNSDIQTVTTGGGRSVGGAVAGGILPGPVDAIVDSRSKTETRDVNRNTVNFVFISENNLEQSLIFEGRDYNTLLQLIE